MDATRDDQVIYFKDLIFAVLYQWRKVLCVAVIFAVLLGGFQAVKPIAGDTDNLPTDEEQMQLYEENLALCEETINTITRNIDVQKKYLQNSIIFKLNPFRVCVGELALNIKIDPQDPPSKVVTLLETFSNMLKDDEALAAAAEGMGIECVYLQELVFSKYVKEGTLLTVTVIGDTEEMVNQLINSLTDYISNSYQQVKAGVGDYKIAEVSRVVSYKAMQDLMDKKTEAEEYLEILEENLETAEANKSALTQSDTSMPAKTAVIKKAVKFAIIGIFAGVMLVAVIAVVQHIFRKKVYSEKTLKNRTGIKVLGCVPAEGKKNMIDRLLMQWDGRTVQENIPFFVANLKNYYRDAEKILVTGVNTDQGERIARYLTEAGMPGVYCGDLTKDADAVQELASCDSVLLVAECHSSCYADVLKGCGMIYEDTQLGCVLING